MPESHYIGGGASASILSPIVAVAMAVTILLMLILPRKYVIVAFLVCIFLVPLGQQIVTGGIHWLAGRILILAGLVRVCTTHFASKEAVFSGEVTFVDKAFLLCMLWQACCVCLLFMQSDALTNQVGFLIDYVGGYVLLRFLIRDQHDIFRAVKCFAILSALIAIGMIIEQMKYLNIFGMLGGVRLEPEIREGSIRSQGVFQHSLLAGAFAATLLPLFLMLWKTAKCKVISAIGILGSSVMTVCSHGSTPLLAYVAGIAAICAWPIRRNMRAVRWGVVASLLLLAMIMKAPVWFVIAHIDLTGGSSGYHRAMLIDKFIRNFGDWFLIGTRDTSNWGTDMWDTQNQYVNIGQTGGIVAFVLFIAMISSLCATIGEARKRVAADRNQQWFFWFLGAALFAHMTAFFGVTYFDQSKLEWLALIAIISAATTPILPKQLVPKDLLKNTEPIEPKSSFESVGVYLVSLNTYR